MTVYSKKVTSVECDFLHAFSHYQWGTIQNDSSVFITGPLTQDESLVLANKINQIWGENRESKKRACYTFKGAIASHDSANRYCVTVSRDTISNSSISTSSSSTAVASKEKSPFSLIEGLLAEHPVIGLKQKRRSSQKTVEVKLQENFEQAQIAEETKSSFFCQTPDIDSECKVVYYQPKREMLHSVGIASFKGGVAYMEDYPCLGTLRFFFENTEYAIPFYSIFDGHSCNLDNITVMIINLQEPKSSYAKH